MMSTIPESKPALVAPVSQYLVVSDAARSVAFYRDVLGFEERKPGNDSGRPAIAEVVNGAARILFGARDSHATNASDDAASILFFETNDVVAHRAAFLARGGAPSRIQRVNWIKMEMFEIRDPDGNILWFGKSYHTDSAPPQRRMMRTIMPILPVSDVAAGIVYYRDVLGFSVNYAQHDTAVMDRDHVRLILIARTERHLGIGSAYVYIENANVLYAELVAKGAYVQGEPVSRPWGLREFIVRDPEGNEIGFGQTFE